MQKFLTEKENICLLYDNVFVHKAFLSGKSKSIVALIVYIFNCNFTEITLSVDNPEYMYWDRQD